MNLFLIGVVSWLFFVPLSCWVRSQNRDEITLGDLFWAIVGGPIYFGCQLDSWDVAIWRRYKNEKRSRDN